MTPQPDIPDAAALRAADAAHHLHPFTDYKALAAEGSRVIVRAEGCTLWDSEGTAILDGMAGLWCVNIGYGSAELAEVAARQMRELPYYNTIFKTTTPQAVELAALLAGLPPAGLDHELSPSYGAEANNPPRR